MKYVNIVRAREKDAKSFNKFVRACTVAPLPRVLMVVVGCCKCLTNWDNKIRVRTNRDGQVGREGICGDLGIIGV